MKEAYLRGLISGITAFAHWEDGVQYVGTCRQPLKETIARIEKITETSSGYLADIIKLDLERISNGM